MVIKALSEAFGVSGHEHEVRDIIIGELSGMVDEMRSDTIGNIITRKGPEKAPKVMLVAHMDEVGLMITFIEKSGALKFAKVGGIDDRVLLSKAVRIGTNRIPGVIGAKPYHLQAEDEREKPVSIDNLYIDIGCKSREEAEKLVSVGDVAVFDTQFCEMGDGYIKGKALDDRIGCALLLEVMKMEWSIPVYGVFSVQEEVGLRGAAVAAYAVEPDMGLALEGTICADLPGVESHLTATQLGKGPAIGLMDATSIPHRAMREQLLKIARDNNLPCQSRRATTGGNDAGMINLTKSGAPAASLSVPCRNIHSAVAMASKQDYDNALKLLGLFLRSVEGGFRP